MKKQNLQIGKSILEEVLMHPELEDRRIDNARLEKIQELIYNSNNHFVLPMEELPLRE